MERATTRLRALLARPGMLLAPFVFDALQAKTAEAAGFDLVYMTGFGTAAARGLPDLGLLSLCEMVDNARTLARSVEIPLVSDADTGYGNALNVVRTVHEFEAAGVAAIHIEDQVWPKRCGFLAGKQVIPLEAMVPKVRAAATERRDPDLLAGVVYAKAPDMGIRNCAIRGTDAINTGTIQGFRFHRMATAKEIEP